MKSCQVLPVIRSPSGFGAAAGAASSGMASGATPTSGSVTVSPALTVPLVTNAPPPAGSSGDSRPGCALGNADDWAKVSCTPTHTAFATPLSGSWS
ncbi:hypothetical protein SALBM217S_04509 [Streptomyces griseoloalbus]